jgi:NAD(P)H-dependent FMN reductase
MGNDCLGKRTDSAVTQAGHKAKFIVAVICGSLRQKSTNKGLLQAIIDAKHPDFEFHWIDIINFPVFDEDTEAKDVPADVKVARKQVY